MKMAKNKKGRCLVEGYFYIMESTTGRHRFLNKVKPMEVNLKRSKRDLTESNRETISHLLLVQSLAGIILSGLYEPRGSP